MITITMQLFDTEVEGKTMKAFAANVTGEPDVTEDFILKRVMSISQNTVEAISGIGQPLTTDARDRCILLICQALNVAAVRSQERPDTLAQDALVKYAKDEHAQVSSNDEIKEKLSKAFDDFLEVLKKLAEE